MRSVLVDPALVVGADVVPSGLELVAHGPHEVTLNVAVEDVHDASTETGDLVVSVVVRVDGAGAVRDGCVRLSKTSLAIWAQSLSCAIEISGVLVKVGVWALNTLAGTCGVSVSVVETAEPQGTDISGKRPFANPDVVLEVLCVLDVRAIFIAVLSDVAVLTSPGEILMSIHDNIFVVVILKEIVPGVWVEVEGVVEDELDVWLL